jgi:proline iminopeptidase
MAQAPTPNDYEHEDAFDTGHLEVDETHKVYYQQYGKKDGLPGT